MTSPAPTPASSSTRIDRGAFALSPTEVRFFHDHGYLGPFAAPTPTEMAAVREHIDAHVLTRDGPNPKTRLQSRHMDSKVVCDLSCHPAIVDRAASLYG